MNLLDFIFPKNCFGCGKNGVYICRTCIEKLLILKGICPACEKPSIDGRTHTKCLTPVFCNGLISIWPYQGVIRKALIHLKYKFAYEIADEISKYLVEILNKNITFTFNNTVVIPVPAHPLRENWRGFNQAKTIAEYVSKSMGWGFNQNLLVRKKIVSPQTGLKGKERNRNIRGVFSLNPETDLSAAAYIVFDDIWTTGSTTKEAVKIIKKGLLRKGISYTPIWVMTIARTV